MALNGGTLNYLGSNGAASPRRKPWAPSSSTGNSTIQTTAGSGAGASVVLTAGIVGRNAGATANLVAGGGQTLGSATNQIIINVPSPAVLTNGIIKGFTVTDGGQRRLQPGHGAPAVRTASHRRPDHLRDAVHRPAATPPSDNVLVTATPTGAIATDTVNAVLIRGDGITISGAAGATLTVGTGMVASSGGTTTGDTISVPTLALGSEGVFITNSGTHDDQQHRHRQRRPDGLRPRQPDAVGRQQGHRHQHAEQRHADLHRQQRRHGHLHADRRHAPGHAPLVVSGAVTLNNSAVTIGGGTTPPPPIARSPSPGR